MKKTIIAAILCLLLFAFAGLFFQRHAVACQLLPLLDYTQIQDQVYVARGVPAEQHDALSASTALAIERITDLYGCPGSNPRLLVVSDEKTAKRWRANATASMHRSPWGPCIIVGPKGQNVDVIAHEWLHAEIQYRVGFWRFLSEIPIWFDEGAGLTLDYREPFLPDNIDLSKETVHAVRRLGTGREFFSGDIRQHYQAARMAVIPLIHDATFFADLSRIANGETFEHVFLSAGDSGSSAVDDLAD